MGQSRLMRTQRNDVTRAVTAAGFDVREFRWMTTDSYGPVPPTGGYGYKQGFPVDIDVLVHAASNCYFRFDFETNRGSLIRRSEFRPGSELAVEEVPASNWGGQLKAVRRWLHNLKRELDAPDLWEQLASGGALTVPDTNDPFTPDEVEQIRAKLDEFEQRVAQLEGASNSEKAALTSYAEEAKESAGRLGRIDWYNVVVGAFVRRVMDQTVSKETATAALELLKIVFAYVVAMLTS